MEQISTSNASPPGGHYAQAVEHNGFIFVSGQLGFKPGTQQRTAGSIEQETRNCLENVAAILEAAGSGLGKIVKVTIYIASIDDWPRVNAVYEEYLGEHRPARAIVPSGKLHHGFNVEIEAIASV